MKKVHIFILSIIAIIVLVVILAVFANKQNQASPELKTALGTVSQCLANNNVMFYGASWCPHCARQKALFMNSAKNLPYTECSVGGAGSPQTQVCIDAQINSYPTWEFTQGVRSSMEISPLDLATLSGCSLTETDTAALSAQKDEFINELPENQRAGYTAELQRIQELLSAQK